MKVIVKFRVEKACFNDFQQVTRIKRVKVMIMRIWVDTGYENIVHRVREKFHGIDDDTLEQVVYAFVLKTKIKHTISYHFEYGLGNPRTRKAWITYQTPIKG